MKLSTFALSAVAAAALAVSAIALPTVAKEMTTEVGGAPMYPSKNIIQNAVQFQRLLNVAFSPLCGG